MPGKRARRHFSQLSKLERSLIIGMKTAGWSTRRVACQVDRSECAVSNCWEQWTRESTPAQYLAEANLISKRPFRALPLTPEHRQLRLQWCQARSMWNVTDWQKVVFSDESRFVLGTAYDSRSPLIVKRGTLTDQRYVDDIHRPHVGSFLNGLLGAVFQQDHARPHTARVAQDFLCHFQTLPWPARSPDFSPVEHV
ncbi:transposable element Tcb2 transposase [Trichonephila clavipes]|uniref:Transposable element Tcb2 transposase n=1 Tax=Trichonephila clavipes TaxID=2585209 RepID=A0A8X6UZJ0_TRICX|nr:transposable element Tcb2 transposase [Trichonephila clavipes]